ncbi:hypothetical protein BJ165DRAFT_1525835 [Panaeolus papilionaceus]|nr:hypothetical protein BJ165DRAFT_1525835 [Panaeolus papilionaceus]
MSAMRLTLTSALTLLFCLILSSYPVSVNASPDTVPFIPTSKRSKGANNISVPLQRFLVSNSSAARIIVGTVAWVSPCSFALQCRSSSPYLILPDGSCCYPNYYCAIASNGIIGCCPDGKLCSGPVDDPTIVTATPTTTRQSTPTLDTTVSTSHVPPVARPTTTSDADFPPLPSTVQPPVVKVTTTPASAPHLVGGSQLVLPVYAICALGMIAIIALNL